VTVVALTIGDRALQLHSAMSFIVEKEITLVGMFSQNGFQTIKAGAPVDIVFDNAPGRIYHAKITAIPKGVGQGRSPCRERSHAPTRSAVRRSSRRRYRYLTR
jgi:multidrug resistance efflux pump